MTQKKYFYHAHKRGTCIIHECGRAVCYTLAKKLLHSCKDYRRTTTMKRHTARAANQTIYRLPFSHAQAYARQQKVKKKY